MTKDDVLFGYRQSLFAEAARTSVAEACRRLGVHRSTYYAWKRQVDRHGLEMLRPRERRAPRMPNQISKVVEERIVAFALGHPGLGPKRVAAELARSRWGGILVSPNGVWKVLCRHGLNTRAKRLGLLAGYAAPYEPPRDPGPERHIDVSRPGELVAGGDAGRPTAGADRIRPAAPPAGGAGAPAPGRRPARRQSIPLIRVWSHRARGTARPAPSATAGAGKRPELVAEDSGAS